MSSGRALAGVLIAAGARAREWFPAANPTEVMIAMEQVLSLQLLGIETALDSSCANSSVSCPSKASCYSHDSEAKSAASDLTW